MNGILHILDQAGMGLLQYQEQMAALEKENAALRSQLGDAPKTEPRT